MQPFLIEPSRAYLSRNANRPSYASRIENGAVAHTVNSISASPFPGRTPWTNLPSGRMRTSS